jgi:hypothetical protein
MAYSILRITIYFSHISFNATRILHHFPLLRKLIKCCPLFPVSVSSRLSYPATLPLFPDLEVPFDLPAQQFLAGLPFGHGVPVALGLDELGFRP